MPMYALSLLPQLPPSFLLSAQLSWGLSFLSCWLINTKVSHHILGQLTWQGEQEKRGKGLFLLWFGFLRGS